MGFHLLRRHAVARHLAIAALFCGLFSTAVSAAVAAGTPAYASSAADLSVTLASGAAAKPGHRVSYRVTVRNAGPSTARKVQAEFVMSTAMSSIRYTISSGRCIRSSKETACLIGTLAKDATASITISGVISKKLKTGAAVNAKVTVLSGTHLTNKTNDVATDDYRVGIPRPAASAASPPVRSETKIDQMKNAATTATKVTDEALVMSLIAIGAAILWFAIGLTVRHRNRRRKAALRDG